MSKLELVWITPGEGSSSWTTFYLKHSEFKIRMPGTFLETTSPFHFFQQLRLPAERHLIHLPAQGGWEVCFLLSLGCGKSESFYASLEKLCYYSLIGQRLVISIKIRKALTVRQLSQAEASILRKQHEYVRKCH